MKWDVEGCNRETGEEATLIIEADTEESARRRAARQGLMVAGVRALDDDDSAVGVVIVEGPVPGVAPLPAAAIPASAPATVKPRVTAGTAQRTGMVWKLLQVARSFLKWLAGKATPLRIAGTLAVVADALQLCLFPVFAEGFFSPIDDAVDVVVAVAMCFLVGFHVVFMPTFLVKEMPVADLAPTWTLAYLFVAHGKKKLSKKK